MEGRDHRLSRPLGFKKRPGGAGRRDLYHAYSCRSLRARGHREDPHPDIEKIKTDVALICVGGDPYVMNPSEAAGVVKKIKPQLAIPNHYGFVVGVDSDGEKFAREAAPIKVEILKPVNAFERTGAAAH